MNKYAENNVYTLYEGKMQEELLNLEDNSVDSIVTDPPYEIGFMGKSWDKTGVAFQKETWEHCLRVLKPGGYLLAFGGSKTFHRIACAIEDAGFEIRDTIMWLYGCLSEDTEILTSNGWRNKDTIKTRDFIYSLNLDENKLVKNKVLNVFKYPYNGEMVNLKNDNTDQLLTPNHHCIIDDKIRTKVKDKVNYNSHDYWYYKDAWSIRSQNVKLPLSSRYNGDIEIGNLFAELVGWIISEGHYHKDTDAISIYQSSVNSDYIKRIKYILGKLGIKYSEYQRERIYNETPYIEHQFYIGKESHETVNRVKQLCPDKKLNWGFLELSYENKEFLLKGLCQGDGSKSKICKFGFSNFTQYDLEQLEIFQVLLHMTNKQGWIDEAKKCCCIHSNPTTELQGKHNKDRFVNYNGYVWCIETELGNFIARRNGKIFITGNSGFPKSLNIGLAVDKRNGVDNRTGVIKQSMRGRGFMFHELLPEYQERIAQNKWSGYGTRLKPAFEPIIVARKPLEGSVVDNILKWGVGGINIDECRVDLVGNEDLARQNKTDNGMFGVGNNNNNAELRKEAGLEPVGRFPANVITDGSDEVASGLPYTSSGSKLSFGSVRKPQLDNLYQLGFTKKESSGQHAPDCYGDKGSIMRYFYSAKVSKKDRDEGLDCFEVKTKVFNGRSSSSSTDMKDVEKRFTTHGKNTHPTVKPTTLMQYLVRLVTPKGGTVLDPFMGSGSTGKATMFENKERDANYKFIGIEMTSEYLPICKARIDFALGYETIDEHVEQQKQKERKVDLF